MKRFTRRGEFVDPFCHYGIFDKRGRVMRFYPCINDERPAAAPMFIFYKTNGAVNIVGGIRPGKRYPKEIVERFCSKFTVVGHNYKRNVF